MEKGTRAFARLTRAPLLGALTAGSSSGTSRFSSPRNSEPVGLLRLVGMKLRPKAPNAAPSGFDSARQLVPSPFAYARRRGPKPQGARPTLAMPPPRAPRGARRAERGGGARRGPPREDAAREAERKNGDDGGSPLQPWAATAGVARGFGRHPQRPITARRKSSRRTKISPRGVRRVELAAQDVVRGASASTRSTVFCARFATTERLFGSATPARRLHLYGDAAKAADSAPKPFQAATAELAAKDASGGAEEPRP